MCNTWYLSMPVGTIFAFRVNAQATLAHLRDSELDETLAGEHSDGMMFVGFVRDISPKGLDIGLLASDPHAFDAVSASTLIPTIRKGVLVKTDVPTPNDATCRRRNSHPILDAPNSLFTAATFSHSPISNIIALPALQSQSQPKGSGLLSSLVSSAEALHPTAPLHWPRAYAYRPSIKHVDSPPLHHRIVVSGYSAAGVACPQVRFGRKEIQRAEKVMDGLREEEEERLCERERDMTMFRDSSFESSSRCWLSPPSSPPPSSPSISSLGSISSRAAVSLTPFSSYSSVDDTLVLPYGLPIFIDIVLDLSVVPALPQSPEAFEEEVARLEGLERTMRRQARQRLEEWSIGEADESGWYAD